MENERIGVILNFRLTNSPCLTDRALTDSQSPTRESALPGSKLTTCSVQTPLDDDQNLRCKFIFSNWRWDVWIFGK